MEKTVRALRKTHINNTDYATKAMETLEAINENIYLKATKGVNNAAKGYGSEWLWKLVFGIADVKVSGQGKVDIYKYIDGKRVKIEVKSGCSKIGVLGDDDEYYYDINDYVIVSFRDEKHHDSLFDALDAYRVLKWETFIDALVERNMVRKVSARKEVRIQTWSKGSRAAKLKEVWEMGQPVIEWADDNKVKIDNRIWNY